MTNDRSHTSNREEKALIIVVAGIIAGLLYPMLKEIGNPYAMANGLIVGILGSAYIAAVELYISNPRNRRLTTGQDFTLLICTFIPSVRRLTLQTRL